LRRGASITIGPLRYTSRETVHGPIDRRVYRPTGGHEKALQLHYPDSFPLDHAASLTSLAARYRLPAVYPYRIFAEVGGLLAYGNDRLENYRRAAGYANRILKGEKPGELPVQFPVKFELVVNLKAGKALRLDLPPSLLGRADEVIE
jgi:putative tryptophan/tyrosine transport system substrate-binding protein